MKKAVIFDLDGLLIDSEVISHRLYDELLHRYGKSVTVAEYARDYSGKTGVANMTNVIARYNLPITVEEGLTWEVAREKELLQDVQLKPGAAADVIVMDYKPFTPFSDANIDGHMLFGMTGRQCQTTMINGRILMKDRVLTEIDEEAVNAHILESSKRLWGRLNHKEY